MKNNLNGNLLLIDDEVLLLKQLKNSLAGHADVIHTATDGLKGLEVLKNNTIHCVVCDINMPKMNGVEVIKKLRGSENHVPFIFYTGHGNKDLMLEAVKYGAFDFLDKPQLEGLEDAVARGLQEGLGKTHLQSSESYYLSEYTKLINEMNKSKA